jgi:hypothetical protein
VERKKGLLLILFLGVEFDYCLVNLYRDGNDYINFHADNEAKDIIASMTLGVTRRYIFSLFTTSFSLKVYSVYAVNKCHFQVARTASQLFW